MPQEKKQSGLKTSPGLLFVCTEAPAPRGLRRRRNCAMIGSAAESRLIIFAKAREYLLHT